MASIFQTFRSLWGSNKGHTAINVFGFAVSLMFVILIGLYIQDELRVDRQYVNGDRIFRVEYEGSAMLPPALGGALENRYPEVEAVTRVYGLQEMKIDPVAGFTVEQTLGKVMFVDSTFFRIFSFPFVEGRSDHVLRTPNEVVLTESFARRLFGDRAGEMVGQMLQIAERQFIVCGVVRDFERTHFANPDLLVRMEQVTPFCFGFEVPEFLEVLNGCYDFSTYVLGHRQANLAERLDTSELHRAFTEAFQLYPFRRGNKRGARLCPLREVYLNPVVGRASRTNSWSYLAILGVAAGAILLFAVINYINLSVAQTEFRAKGAAIRLLLGETRGRLLGGFIVESVVMCFVSLLIGLGLAYAVEPWFQQILHTSVRVSDGLTAGNILLLLGGVLVVGAVSGLVPATVISRYKPIDVVRGTLVRQSRMTFGKALIVSQYAIAIVLIGCTITIGRQVRYMQTQDLGFETHCILGMTNNWLLGAGGQDGTRSQLMEIPGVERISFVRNYPTDGGAIQEWTLENGERMQIRQFEGDTAFLALMGFEVLHRTGIDDAEAVWLNETAWRRLGLSPEATEVAANSRLKLKLKGRIRDFHFEDYTRPVGPVMINTLPSYERPYQILIQVSKGDPYGTRERIRLFNNERTGGETFDGRFLDERVAAQYDRQRQMAEIIGTLSIVAIVIAALGMLAMATYYTRQREREVAVRKVFGSTTGEVLLRVLGSFGKMVGVAFVVAVPIILYLMREWLSGYAYRISLSWTIFALAGGVALLIAGGSVLWQSIRTVHTNPVEVLRK